MADENKGGAIPPLESTKPAVTLNSKKSSRVAIFPLFLVSVLVIAIFVIGGIFSFRKYMAYHMAEVSKENQEQNDARHSNNDSGVNFINGLKSKIQEKENRKKEEAAAEQQKAQEEALQRKALELKQQQEKLQQQQAQAALPPPSGSHAGSRRSASGEQEISPEERKLEGDILMKLDTGTVQTAAGTSAAKDGLDEDLQPSELAGSKATVLPDQHYLLSRGTIIPCVLETKIISTYKGMTKCQITEDIYSSDGTVLLFERGSMITGEQRKAMLQGQAKIFVLWSQVRTPNRVVANVNSPGTDTLGATGQDAWVDTHWWARFGNGILLSVIEDGLQTAANSAQDTGDNNNITYDNSSNTAQQMSSEALKNSIDIPPTAYTNQGALLNVFVSRDIDFREVYSVR